MLFDRCWLESLTIVFQQHSHELFSSDIDITGAAKWPTRVLANYQYEVSIIVSRDAAAAASHRPASLVKRKEKVRRGEEQRKEYGSVNSALLRNYDRPTE